MYFSCKRSDKILSNTKSKALLCLYFSLLPQRKKLYKYHFINIMAVVQKTRTFGNNSNSFYQKTNSFNLYIQHMDNKYVFINKYM